jgi:hypothetical protein
MADPRSVIVVDSTGAPLTSGTPGVQAFNRATGASRTAPAIAHLPAVPGTWRILPTDDDETVGTVVLVDFGAGNLPRFWSFQVHKADNSNQFWAVPVVGADGSAWAGAAPTFGGYSGSPTPSLTAMPGAATALYTAAPSSGDITTGAEGRIDGPAGSSQPFWNVSTLPASTSSPWEAPSPGPVKNPALDVVNFLDTKAAGSLTLAKGTNLFVGPERSFPRTAASCVFALNTGGPGPEPYLGGRRTALFRPTVQLLVRAGAGDLEAGEAIARAVFEWLHQYVLIGYTSLYVRDSAPVYLGEFDQRHRWAINVECQYRSSLAP